MLLSPVGLIIDEFSPWKNVKIHYSGFKKEGDLIEFHLLWGWLIWVGESIEPGELTDRGKDDKFISFACSFCCCCSCEN